MSNAKPLSLRGRPVIFTPERINQIRYLLEQNQTAEQIAEIIGCTVGTLRVRCSQFGISLRPLVPRMKTNGEAEQPEFLLHFSYRGRSRTMPLMLSDEAVKTLVLEAEVRKMRVSDLLASIVENAVQRGSVNELASW